jgi:UDP-N-acetylmuramate: L-alanyl-gamma-D-glutamyl-meso-diaminopimelate ligase
MSLQLAELGIQVHEGYSASNLDGNPDLIVVGNAVSRTNPEVQAMLEQGIPFLSFPQALREFFLGDRHPIVVAGTHGKTTTASLMAWVLETAGLQPSYMIGGIPRNFGANYRLGAGDFFVVEGDEYDTAFFDKGPKFLHYRPQSAILTSIEFDHGDIYRDLEHVKDAFRRFIRILPPSGYLAAGVDFPAVAELTPSSPCPWEGYGLAATAAWQAAGIDCDAAGTRFDVLHAGGHVGTASWGLAGRHNVQNALGVIAVATRVGIPFPRIEAAFRTFAGVKRRQEVIGAVRDIVLIDDFAHHPTAVRETLLALRSRYRGHRLWAIFEPRSTTSRQATFQRDFVAAFGAADRIIIADLFRPEYIPIGERLSPERLARDITATVGTDARFIPEVDAIIAHVVGHAVPGDVVVLMSNGGFGGIHAQLLHALKEGTAGRG